MIELSNWQAFFIGFALLTGGAFVGMMLAAICAVSGRCDDEDRG